MRIWADCVIVIEDSKDVQGDPELEVEGLVKMVFRSVSRHLSMPWT